MRYIILLMVLLTKILRTTGLRSAMHEWENKLHVKCRASPYPRSDVKVLKCKLFNFES